MNRFRSIVLAAVFGGLVSVSAAFAQNISVVSGNGQVLSGSNLLLQPLVVKVTDANGNPLSGQTVNWNASSFTGIYGFFLATGTNQATSLTDQTGQAAVYGNVYSGSLGSSSFLTSIAQTFVTATLASGSGVNFTLTQVLASGTASGVSAEAFISEVDPSKNQTTFPAQTFSGAVGTTSSQTIQVWAHATNGEADVPIPNAAIQLLNFQNPSTGPAVACVQTDPSAGFGTVLTDANGNATCTVAFGAQPGNGQFVVALGGVSSATATPAGFWQFSPTDPTNPTPISAASYSFILNETVTPGTPGSITITQGNGQSANPAQALTTPLQVQVKSTAGQPLSGVKVNWTVSPVNGAVLTLSSATTDYNGLASASVTLAGNPPATVTVTATVAGSSSLSQTFTITVNSVTPPVTITNLSIVSGNNQSASVMTAFAQPLVVQVTTSAGSPAGITVQFSSSGPVSLSATTATTDSNGRAQVNVTALNAQGAATVVASVAGVGSQTFSLAVTPPAPTITAGNFVNGADLQPNSLSPCGLGALVSAGTLGATSAASTFPGLPVTSTNVSINFSNTAAPILSIGTNPAGQQQITFQVPCTVTPSSSVPVTVTVGAGATNVNVPVGAASPGIFQTQMSDGVLRALLVRPDGSYVSLQNPARRGETEIAFVTGLGATSPPVGTGALPVPGTTATVQGAVVPGMTGQAVPLVYARLSEDLPGVYLVAFQIPATMNTGNNVTLSVGIQVSGTTTYSGLSTIPVQ